MVLFFDKANRRILIEGIAARYQIRGEDVVSLGHFIFTNYIGVRILCRVGEAELCIAVAKVSLLYELQRQAPVLFFLKRWIKNPILASAEQALFDSRTKLARASG